MGRFQSKYSDEQREAIQYAWVDRAITPRSRIRDLAAAGELELNGELVPAFEITESSARAIGERYARRRANDRDRGQNGAETFRAELSGMIADELSYLRRLQSRGQSRKPINPAQLTGLVRAVRELRALETERTPAPKQKGSNGRRADGTPGGNAADKVRAAMAGGSWADTGAATDDTTSLSIEVGEDGGEQSAGADARPEDQDQDGIYGDGPGEYARAAIDGLRARAVVQRPAGQ